jgi:hypothetical protein
MPIRIGNTEVTLPPSISRVYVGSTLVYDNSSPPSDYELDLSEPNAIDFNSSLIESPSDNKWAIMTRLRNYVWSSEFWGCVIGAATGGNGVFALGRTWSSGSYGDLHYRDITASTWHHDSDITSNDFAGATPVDFLAVCDGTNIVCSISNSISVTFTIAETPPLTCVGNGYEWGNEGAEISVQQIKSWNLEGRTESFARDDILALTPSHQFNLNEGTGLSVSDAIGSIVGTIRTDDPGMWNAI